jgi:hypothetical protein
MSDPSLSGDALATTSDTEKAGSQPRAEGRGSPSEPPRCRRSRLSKDIAQLYLYGLEGEWGLTHFRGITTSPILKGDGTVRIADGYDRETGLWCHNIPDLNIPERPTDLDAQDALHRLRRFFRTFPFAHGRARSRSRAGRDRLEPAEVHAGWKPILWARRRSLTNGP